MSTDEKHYTPRAGSLAQRVIDYLTTHGGALNAAQINAEFGGAPSATATTLRKATNAGYLATSKKSNAFIWSLPEAGAGQQADGTDSTDEAQPMLIAAWSDGDVTVKGLDVSEDGTVIFSAAQIGQLIAHMTRPLHPQTPIAAVQA